MNASQASLALARTTGPTACCVALLLALSIPTGLPGQAMLRLAAMLGAVFHWSCAPSTPLPAWAAFALGLTLDLLGLDPFGGSALLLVLAQAAGAASGGMFASDEAGGERAAGWAAFAAAACGCAALQWGLVSILSWRTAPALPGLLLAVLAIGLYPVLSALFALPSRAFRRGRAPIEA